MLLFIENKIVIAIQNSYVIPEGILAAISLIIILSYFLSIFSQAVRRGHDFSQSFGKTLLIFIIPVIGGLVLLFTPGDTGTNQYGHDPIASKMSEVEIKMFVEKRLKLAQQWIENENYDLALEFVIEGLKISPDDSELLSLKKQIEDKSKNSRRPN